MTPTAPLVLPLDPAAYVAAMESAARDAGFRVETFGEVAGQRILGCTKRTAGPRPRIYLSAGIHGDEPAGPVALLSLMQRGFFDRRAVWLICPMLNPVGFTKRTRENAEGFDLNRDYRALKSVEIQAHIRWLRSQPNFDLSLCVHEDWESKGYYLYELNPLGRPTLANAMIAAVEKVCPIETASVIDGREISERGIIRPVSDPLLRELWPESIYLRAHHSQLSYTIESPSAFAIEERVDAHCAAIQAAISGVVGADVRAAARST